LTVEPGRAPDCHGAPARRRLHDLVYPIVPSVRIIGRYVLREHVGPFVFASSALTSLMLLQYIAKKFGDLVGKGLPASVIAEFMMLSVPFTVAMTLPMAVLVAVLYAFSRLASENEITAMKASGLSMRRIVAPVLLGGLGMSVVMMFFNDQVLPRANHRLAVLQLDIFRTKPTFALREQVINEIKSGQLYLRAGNIDEGSSRMEEVVIYDLTDPSRRRTIYADSGRLALAPNRTDLELVLFHGVMQEVPNKNPDELNRMFYEKTTRRVRNVVSSYQESTTGHVSKGDREMSVCEMQKELARADYYVQVARYDLAVVEHELRQGPRPVPPRPGNPAGIGKAYCALLSWLTPSEASAQTPAAAGAAARGNGGTLPVEADDVMYQQRTQEARFRLEDARRDRNRYDVEIQKKFSLAAACMIFVLIGAPIALRFPRGGVGLVIGVSFAVFGLYYVGLIGGETLADKGYLPPWLAMWAANIVLLLAGLVLVARMGRESSTSRGGDFSELAAAARARVFGWLRRFGIAVERRRA
jgi:lipopolysaccharide export system permease protein